MFAHFLLLLPWPPHPASARWYVLLCELPDECTSFTVVFCLPSAWVWPSYFAQATPSALRREQAQARNSETTAVQVETSQCLQSQWPINHQPSPKTQGDTAGPSMATVTVRTYGTSVVSQRGVYSHSLLLLSSLLVNLPPSHLPIVYTHSANRCTSEGLN